MGEMLSSVAERDRRLGSFFGDELLEESDSLVVLYDLLGDQINQLSRFLGVDKIRSGVKDVLSLVIATAVGATMGGFGQILSEQSTAVVNGQQIEKFVHGMNWTEEFIEGGVSAAGGVILGEIIYRLLVATGKAKPNESGRIMLWSAGSMVGYMGMFFLGDLLHQVLNIPDVPTMEIIKKVFGG